VLFNVLFSRPPCLSLARQRFRLRPDTDGTKLIARTTRMSRTLYSMIRDSASGPEIGLPGRIWAVLKEPKSALRPAEGWPKDQSQCFPGSSPAKSGPEGRFPARKHYCVT
jgi:hypothetical protein